jgi:Fe-S oxidoreductase
VLRAVGVDVVLCADSHLCCGSAGSYSLLQPELSRQLRDRKLASLADTGASTIVSANVGCSAHLQIGHTNARHALDRIAGAGVGLVLLEGGTGSCPAHGCAHRDAG